MQNIIEEDKRLKKLREDQRKKMIVEEEKDN